MSLSNRSEAALPEKGTGGKDRRRYRLPAFLVTPAILSPVFLWAALGMERLAGGSACSTLLVVAIRQVEQFDDVHDALLVAVEADAGLEL